MGKKGADLVVEVAEDALHLINGTNLVDKVALEGGHIRVQLLLLWSFFFFLFSFCEFLEMGMEMKGQRRGEQESTNVTELDGTDLSELIESIVSGVQLHKQLDKLHGL